MIKRLIKRYRLPRKVPLLFMWPISRERYRQALRKLHRRWEEIQNLKLEIEHLKQELAKKDN